MRWAGCLGTSIAHRPGVPRPAQLSGGAVASFPPAAVEPTAIHPEGPGTLCYGHELPCLESAPEIQAWFCLS